MNTKQSAFSSKLVLNFPKMKGWDPLPIYGKTKPWKLRSFLFVSNDSTFYPI